MAIALVSGQVISGQNLAGNTLALVLPTAPTKGNLVCVAIITNFATSAMIVADGNSNSYTQTPLGLQPDFNSLVKGATFYLRNVPSNGSATINLTATGGSDVLAAAAEFSGVETAATLIDNEVVSATNTAQTNINAPSIVPVANGELLFGWVDSVAGFLTSIDSPWNIIGSVQSAAFAAGYIIQTTKTTQAMAATQSAASPWLSYITAFDSMPGLDLSMIDPTLRGHFQRDIRAHD